MLEVRDRVPNEAEIEAAYHVFGDRPHTPPLSVWVRFKCDVPSWLVTWYGGDRDSVPSDAPTYTAGETDPGSLWIALKHGGIKR